MHPRPLVNNALQPTSPSLTRDVRPIVSSRHSSTMQTADSPMVASHLQRGRLIRGLRSVRVSRAKVLLREPKTYIRVRRGVAARQTRRPEQIEANGNQSVPLREVQDFPCDGCGPI